MKPARQEVQLMAFAPIETRSPHPEAWLVHPVLWLQPELSLSPPPLTVLRIERRHGFPSPQFAPLPFSWGRLPGPGGTLPARAREARLSAPPASELEPLRPLL
jgi:hypothetical protein